MRTLLILAVAVTGLLAARHVSAPQKPIPIPPAAAGQAEDAPRPIQMNVVAYTTRDERINAAKARARETLPRFIALLNGPSSGTASVKFPLTQNGATEHIWLQVSAHQNGQFHGRLANKPVNGDRYAMGDRLTVPEAQVEDWNIIDGDTIYGAYTTRAILADIPAERARMVAKNFRD